MAVIDVIAPLALPSHNTQLDNHEEKFMTTQKTGAQAQTRDASPEQQPVREQIEEFVETCQKRGGAERRPQSPPGCCQ